MASMTWKPWMTCLILLGMASTAFLGGCGKNDKNGAAPIRGYKGNVGVNKKGQSKLMRLGNGETETDKTPIEVSVVKNVLQQAHTKLFSPIWKQIKDNKNADATSVFQYMATRLSAHSGKDGWVSYLDACPLQQRLQSKVVISKKSDSYSDVNSISAETNIVATTSIADKKQNQLNTQVQKTTTPDTSNVSVDYYMVKDCSGEISQDSKPVAKFQFLNDRTRLKMTVLVASMPEAVGLGRAWQATTIDAKKAVTCYADLNAQGDLAKLSCAGLGQTMKIEGDVETFVEFNVFSYDPKGADLHISQFVETRVAAADPLVNTGSQAQDPKTKKIIQLRVKGTLWKYTQSKGALDRAQADGFGADVDESMESVGPIQIEYNKVTPAEQEAQNRELERRNNPAAANQRQAPVEPVAAPAPPPPVAIDPQQQRNSQDSQNQQDQDDKLQKAVEAKRKAALEKQKEEQKAAAAKPNDSQQQQQAPADRQERPQSDRQEQSDLSADQARNDAAASAQGGVVPSFR